MSANAAGNFLNSGTGDAAAKESPVSSLFLSNRAPTDCEVSAIKQIIREGEEEVGTLQRILSEPTTPADQQAIQSRLSHLDQLLKSHRALLSSIRFLPTELIALIFLHFAAENKDPINNPSPWILCLVCRHWRQIALVTPVVWSNLPPIRLLNVSNPTRLESVISALTLRLSGDLPLSFYLESMIPRRLYTPILELLLSQAERWENVSLSISGITRFGLFGIKRRLPLLRCLKLNIHSASAISFDMFKVAPNLREVNLVSKADLQIDLPWNQLTSYEEESTRVDRLYLALQSASDTLQNIRFTTNRLAPYRHSGVTQNILAVLPRLEALTLESFHYPESPLGILDKLTLPALQNMVFRSFSANDFGFQLQNLIKRSSCVIQSLTFHEVPNHTCLVPILELTPHLTSLSINDPNTSVIHDLLCLRDGRTWMLLPNLRSLKIHLTADRTNPEDLQRLALARCDLSTIDAKDGKNTKVLETFELSFSMNINGLLGALPCLKLGSLDSDRTFGDQVKSLYADILKLKNQLDGIPIPSKIIIRKAIQVIRRPEATTVLTRLDKVMSKLNKLQVTAGNVQILYVSGLDYLLRDIVNESSLSASEKIANLKDLEILFQRWRPKLIEAAPNLLWRWDDDGYLSYTPTTERSTVLPDFRRTTQSFETLPASTEFHWPKLDPENM